MRALFHSIRTRVPAEIPSPPTSSVLLPTYCFVQNPPFRSPRHTPSHAFYTVYTKFAKKFLCEQLQKKILENGNKVGAVKREKATRKGGQYAYA